MNNIKVRIYSCYEKTYKRVYQRVLRLIYGNALNFNNVELDIIDLSDGGKRGIQSQRSLEEYITRAIYIYEDNKLKHLVGLSNTNLDYDKRHEKELNPSLKYVFNDPKKPYHGNAYFKQGTPKLFNYYFRKKRIFPDLTLSFYLLDTELNIPSNMFNVLTWRELQTIGFKVLNICDIDFSNYEKTCSRIIDKQNIAFGSFNKYINDIARISRNNTGNKPSFLQTSEHCEINEQGEFYYVDRYIYTFKTLSAQGYDTLFRAWCLKTLAAKENVMIEFRLGKQYFNYASDEMSVADKLTGPILETFKNAGIEFKFFSNDEFLIERNMLEGAYLSAKRKKNPRNQLLFRNNLRKKGVPIQCMICGNDDPTLLKAAHIWEVSDIKNADNSTINEFLKENNLYELIDQNSSYKNELFYKKYCLTNSGDNGIWLCGTHHDMFDLNYFCFESSDGQIQLLHFENATQQQEFINNLREGTNTKIPRALLTNATKAFIAYRKISFRC